MSTPPHDTPPNLFSAAPIESALVSVVPIGLALTTLANSYLNDLSPAVAIAFAVSMLAFSIVATGHLSASYRLQRLERQLRPPR